MALAKITAPGRSRSTQVAFGSAANLSCSLGDEDVGDGAEPPRLTGGTEGAARGETGGINPVASLTTDESVAGGNEDRRGGG